MVALMQALLEAEGQKPGCDAPLTFRAAQTYNQSRPKGGGQKDATSKL
jgi:hypothetical protein